MLKSRTLFFTRLDPDFRRDDVSSRTTLVRGMTDMAPRMRKTHTRATQEKK